MTHAAPEADSPLETAARRVFTRRVRAWLYGVVIAAQPLVVALGLASDGITSKVVAVIGAALGVAGATAAAANLSGD
jgi:hypothetical protein